MPSQNASTASASFSRASAGIIAQTSSMKRVLVARLRRQRMRAEERRHHVDVALAPEPARRAQLLRFALAIEPVAGLDLDRGDAFGDQRVEPRQALRDELVLARRARRLHGRDDAAAGARDLLVGRAGEPQLELVRAVARIDEMGVAIDQAGRDPAAVERDALRRVPAGRQIGHRRPRRRCGRPSPRPRRARSRRGPGGRRKRRQAGIEPDRYRTRHAIASVVTSTCFPGIRVCSVMPSFSRMRSRQAA